jgi:hypothetical protein
MLSLSLINVKQLKRGQVFRGAGGNKFSGKHQDVSANEDGADKDSPSSSMIEEFIDLISGSMTSLLATYSTNKAIGSFTGRMVPK